MQESPGKAAADPHVPHEPVEPQSSASLPQPSAPANMDELVEVPKDPNPDMAEFPKAHPPQVPKDPNPDVPEVPKDPNAELELMEVEVGGLWLLAFLHQKVNATRAASIL